MLKNKIKAGMTLAETLIVVLIIGVVCAMTIPALNNLIQDSEHKTAYKKAYSDASNIWASMVADNEVIPCNDLDAIRNNECTYPNFETFKSRMRVSKDCATGSVNNCWNISGESLYEIQGGGTGNPIKPGGTGSRGFVDESGRSWIMATGALTWGLLLAVDTNGFKLPNKFGKDRQVFWVVLRNGKGVWGNGNPFPGMAVKLVPSPDRNAVELDCGYPPCKGTSWLYD